MPEKLNVQHLDIAAFARQQASASGHTNASAYPRLAQELVGDAAASTVAWQAQGQWLAQTGGAGQPWLYLQAHTTVALTCQRCLQPVDVALEVDRAFRFVKDEATAEAQDDECEEDLLAMSRDFDLPALIEDELLMALPLVPRHAVCPVALPMQTQADAPQEAQERPHPFAALAQLRSAPKAED